MSKVMTFFFMVFLGFSLFAFDCSDIWGTQTIQYKKTSGTTGFLNFRFEDSGVGDGSWYDGSNYICLYSYYTPGWPPYINGWPPTIYPSNYLTQVMTIRLEPNSNIRLVYSSGYIPNYSISTTRNKQIWDVGGVNYDYADEYNITYDSRYYQSGAYRYMLDDRLVQVEYRVQYKVGFIWYDTNYIVAVYQYDYYNWY